MVLGLLAVEPEGRGCFGFGMFFEIVFRNAEKMQLLERVFGWLAHLDNS